MKRRSRLRVRPPPNGRHSHATSTRLPRELTDANLNQAADVPAHALSCSRSRSILEETKHQHLRIVMEAYPNEIFGLIFSEGCTDDGLLTGQSLSLVSR